MLEKLFFKHFYLGIPNVSITLSFLKLKLKKSFINSTVLNLEGSLTCARCKRYFEFFFSNLTCGRDCTNVYIVKHRSITAIFHVF